jgi:hypothetical protein
MAKRVPAVDRAAFDALVANHSAWYQSAHAMLSTAQLIWPPVQKFHDVMAAHIENVRREFAVPGVEQQEPKAEPISLVQRMEYRAFGSAYLMNGGYAVENFLKAVRAKRLTVAGTVIRFGPDGIPTHHRYVEFARTELGALMAGEVSLLQRLEICVIWAGRYPVSLEPNPVELVKGHELRREDRDEVNALCQRLIDKYRAL